MKFLWIFLLWCGFVVGSEAPQIFFETAAPSQVSEIHEKMTLFYAQELFDAKVYADKNQALEAAIEECNSKNDGEIVYYYLLLSKEPETKYGYLVYSINNNTAYLEALYLEPEYRGQGLSKQILHNFEAELREKNINTIQLYVFAHNLPAIRLYEKMGYTVENTYSNDHHLIGYRMKKELYEGSFL